MRKIHLELQLETNDLIGLDKLEKVIVLVIQNMFFTDSKVTSILVREDEEQDQARSST